MLDSLHRVVQIADNAILIYFVAVNTSLLILIVLGGLELLASVRRRAFRGADLTHRSPLTPSISVVVPAYNESSRILTAVHAMLALRYPRFEVVVVDDGSTDDTFARLHQEFDLVQAPRVVPDSAPLRGQVLATYVPRTRGEPLTVVRKANGGRADALNAGIDIARSDLVYLAGADSVLDGDALLTMAKPFVDDPVRVVASGAVVRIANGCTVVGGRVVDAGLPRRWLPRIQVVEYLRAFLLGRSGWSRIGSATITAGVFGLFRRDVLLELGGLSLHSSGEDAELVMRLHRRFREQQRDYRMVFVAEPVSWIEVPDTVSGVARQRRRWHRGLADTMLTHRRMLGNPRYGRTGVLALPYYLLFELIAPIVEIAAVVLVPTGLIIGAVDLDFGWRFLLVAYGYATVVSLTGLALAEAALHRYRRWRDLALLVVASVVENIGYRQAIAVWRLQGLWAALRRNPPQWGDRLREGFGDSDDPATPPPPTAPARSRSRGP